MNLISPQLEYIRSKQKDSEILSYLTTSALDCARDWLNSRYTPEIVAFSEIFYLASSFFLTKVKQTPGQEHTSTALADFYKVNQFKRVLVSTNYVLAASKFAPSLLKLVLYIFFKVFWPYLLKNIKFFSQKKESSNENSKTTKNFFKNLPSFDDFMQEAIKINFAVFLLTGYYDEISKRLLGMVYVKLIRPNTANLPLKNLGYVLLLQSFFSIYSLFREFFKKMQEKDEKLEEKIEQTEQNLLDCSLCLSEVTNPTATPCGHIFCWSCILKSSFLNTFCPNCRQPITPQSLLQLRNL